MILWFLIRIVVASITTLCVFVDSCDPSSNFCLSLWHKEISNDRDQPAPVFLGRDANSGCFCKENPGKLVICFGRELCTRFPRDVKVRAVMLRVKTTAIETLQKGDLEKLRHLQTLEIEGNGKLHTIEAGVFIGMNQLKNLSISYSEKLEALAQNVFDGLVNLEYLFLMQNGFTNLKDITPALSPNYLPNIYKLSLNENLFRKVAEDDFAPMEATPLMELNLVLCQIEYLHPACLSPLKNLTALRLGENVFNTTTIADLIETSVDLKIPLKLLNLYSVGFRIEPPKKLINALRKSNITNLSLARNQFEFLRNDSFVNISNLEILDLREVLALNVSSGAFVNMTNLRTLLLSGNKLSFIPDGVLLKQLSYLDLSDNSGNVFVQSYFSLGKNRFLGMTNLKVLNLSYNRINGVFNDTFNGLINLAILGLKNATIFYLANNSFAQLQNLKFLNLENNPLGKTITLTKEIFNGLQNLEVLLLGGCSLSSLNSPFFHLKSLQHLGLEKNYLHTLEAEVFLPLVNLKSIDISRNSLLTWQQRNFLWNQNLTRISASHNKFTYLSDAMLEDFENLDELDIAENPFSCDCAILQTWPNNSIIALLKNNSAFCVYPDTEANLTLYEYYRKLEEFPIICENNILLLITVPLLTVLLVIAATALALYRFRWHLRYWIFLVRLHLSRTGKLRTKTPKKSFTNYQYDAFVSYCNEDRNFVIRLVAMLENYQPYLKLCVYERDFQVGSIISESVLESVAKSRKTLLVISDSYARSQWCRWETQIAEHHRLFFENEYGEYVDDSLVLIKLGPVCENHLTPTLKYLLKTRIYLQWDADPKKQRVFWEKLRGTLAPPKKLISDETV